MKDAIKGIPLMITCFSNNLRMRGMTALSLVLVFAFDLKRCHAATAGFHTKCSTSPAASPYGLIPIKVLPALWGFNFGTGSETESEICSLRP
jgi:hypothetical protein